MKPVAVFRHAPSEGPGYFASFLSARNIPFTLVAIDADEPVPQEVRAFSGLVFMGGPMSVNDDLPWIPSVLTLIRAAVEAGIPVLGHCLGGQLMARALGARVGRNAVKEIGWGRVSVRDVPEAKAWFGDLREFDAFHWHGETFELPQGAAWLLESFHCAHQAFALGPHLALQCHVEMTRDMIEDWCRVGAEELETAKASPAVQSAEGMMQDVEARLAALHAVADRLYGQWVQGLQR